MSLIEVYSPIATPRVQQRDLAARLAALDGCRLAWLDNLKANAGTLLEGVVAELRGSGRKLETVSAVKEATAAAPAANPVLRGNSALKT